ncbi:thioesterase family protein [Mycolicibacterium flavescens]|uniref:Acyl-CoA thioesterase n=1 Tax=Mycolicibacterium flavescens TaxID=1776 RepID=A0A1E3RMX3_MYCFV|nr:thioesterase family protein [Mycolicibacterium flavescens]MCV7281850.1 thioesterase family protein [Mycolicibacterium flavescens]ODQ90772.1 acyl-CoA thioesterase [Mycolicibacterium flavescens]
MTHPFDAAIDLTPRPDHRLVGRTVPEYANMVGPFGGATAAALLHAVEQHPDRAGDPIALTVNFAAPVADGEFTIDTTLVRANRTNQHWTATLSQDDGVMSTATAVFGTRRDAWSATEAWPPDAPQPDAVERRHGPEGITWMQNYDMRFVKGLPPVDGVAHESSTSTLWVRHDPARVIDFTALAALADVFYPRVFLRRGRPVPAGTISMTTYFHVDGAELAEVGDDFVLATARGHQFARGYFDQTAQLWSRGGVLLASSNQTVYYKDSFSR